MRLRSFDRRGSVLLHVLVTGVLVAFIAASLLRMAMLRYTLGARGGAALAQKRYDQAGFNSLMTSWNGFNGGVVCSNPAGSDYVCSPASFVSPGSCNCVCTTALPNFPIVTVTPGAEGVPRKVHDLRRPAVTGRSLIVTADDFGFSADVNTAVVRAHREGILRFASLMVLRPGAAEAAALTRENPGLGVGLHLELCADSPEKAGLRYFFDAKARAGLEGEIRAQFDALRGLGVTPTHVDGHINIHVHPVVFPTLCRVAREYGVPRVRLPGGEHAVASSFPGPDDASVPVVLSATFSAMGAWVRGAAKGLTVPRTWGLLRSGRMSEEYVLWLISHLPEGLTEIYFHPTSDPDSDPGPGRATPSHQTIRELRILLSPRVREALAEAGVTLVAPKR